MESCTFDGSMRSGVIRSNVPDIRYIDMSFKNFSAREVVVNGVNIGEFHINFKCMNPLDSVNYIKTKITAEVSLIDPDNVLKLEHNIYIKIDPDSMDAMMIGDIFNDIDEEISKRSN